MGNETLIKRKIKMSNSEILNNIWDGTKIMAGGLGAYFITLLGCELHTFVPFQKKIESKKELEKVVREEAEKLKLREEEIPKVFYPSDSTYVTKNEEGFEMHFYEEGISCTRKMIKHELMHIKKDNKDVRYNFFRHWFIEEPRATLYGTFNFKLK